VWRPVAPRYPSQGSVQVLADRLFEEVLAADCPDRRRLVFLRSAAVSRWEWVWGPAFRSAPLSLTESKHKLIRTEFGGPLGIEPS